MFKCDNCHKEFEEPKTKRTTYEAYYGLDDGYHTPCIIELCPYCKSEDFEEVD